MHFAPHTVAWLDDGQRPPWPVLVQQSGERSDELLVSSFQAAKTPATETSISKCVQTSKLRDYARNIHFATSIQVERACAAAHRYIASNGTALQRRELGAPAMSQFVSRCQRAASSAAAAAISTLTAATDLNDGGESTCARARVARALQVLESTQRKLQMEREDLLTRGCKDAAAVVLVLEKEVSLDVERMRIDAEKLQLYIPSIEPAEVPKRIRKRPVYRISEVPVRSEPSERSESGESKLETTGRKSNSQSATSPSPRRPMDSSSSSLIPLKKRTKTIEENTPELRKKLKTEVQHTTPT